MLEGSNKHKYLDFHETSEERIARGSLEEQQLQEVSRSFNQAFDEFMLRHMDGVGVFDRASKWQSARLFGNLSFNNEEYDLALTDYNPGNMIQPPESESIMEFRSSEIFSRNISFHRLVKSRRRDSWAYRFCKDDVVRRYDLGDIWQRDCLKAEMGANENDYHTSDLQALQDLIELKNVFVPNIRLEEDMGLNNQPVSLQEIQGLLDFMARGTFVPRLVY